MRFFILLVITSFLLISCGQNEPNAKNGKTPIRFPHVVKRDTPKGIGAQMLKRLVNEDSDLSEKFKFEVYPEAVLYDDENVIDALLNNKIQFAAPSLSIFSKKADQEKQSKFQKDFSDFVAQSQQGFDKFDGSSFANVAAVQTFQANEEGQKLLHSVEKICKNTENGEKNCLVGLHYWHNGMKQLSTKKPCPADGSERSEDALKRFIKDLTFRIQDSAVIKQEFDERWRAKGLFVPFSKTSKALRDGRFKGQNVDGQENTWTNILAEGYNKDQNCFIETNHGYLGYIVLTNKKFWDALEAPKRTSLENKLNEVTEKVNLIAEKYNQRDRGKLEKGGAKILVLQK